MRPVLVVLALAAALAAPSAPAEPGITTFEAPSGNVLCAHLHTEGAAASLRCDILGFFLSRGPWTFF